MQGTSTEIALMNPNQQSVFIIIVLFATIKYEVYTTITVGLIRKGSGDLKIFKNLVHKFRKFRDLMISHL